MSRWIFGALAFILSFSALAQSQGDPNKYSTTPGNSSCRFFDGFSDNGDGTVTDPRNGLMWKRCAEGFDWNGVKCVGKVKAMSWVDAMKTAKQSRFLGKNDWRLPSKAEFSKILGPRNIGGKDACSMNSFKEDQFAASKKIDHSMFKEEVPVFWSTSPVRDNIDSVWIITIDNGGFMPSDRIYPVMSRLVRSSTASTGNVTSEFNLEYAKIDKVSNDLISKKTEEAVRQAKSLQQYQETACKEKYVGQRLHMGSGLFGVDVFGKVIGVGKKNMTVEIQHPAGWRTQEFLCYEY